MKNMFYTLFVSLLLGITALHAQDNSPFVTINGHIGGDEITSVVDANQTQQTIYGHSGISFQAGYNLYLTDNIAVSLSAGFMYSTVEKGDTNTTLTLSRFPVEALIYFDLETVRLGGGVVYHLGTTLYQTTVANGTTTYDSMSFLSDPGSVYFVEYNDAEQGIYYGLKFTQMRYEHEGTSYCADGVAAYVGQRY